MNPVVVVNKKIIQRDIIIVLKSVPWDSVSATAKTPIDPSYGQNFSKEGQLAYYNNNIKIIHT